MKPVTDPAILAQLNAPQAAPQAPQGLKPVTDPAILEQLNAEPSLLQKAGNYIGEVKDAFVGNPQHDFEELPRDMRVPSNEAKASGAMDFIEGNVGNIGQEMGRANGNMLGMANIYQKHYPDAEIDFDDSGYPFVKAPQGAVSGLNDEPLEGRYYLNKAGFSGADAQSLLNQGAFEVLGGKGAGMLAKGLGRFGRAVATGAGAGAGSMSADRLGQIAGSDVPIDQKKAMLIAGFGAAGELAGPLVNKFFSKFLTNKSYATNGKLTAEGKKAFENAGFDPDDMSPKFIKTYQEIAGEAADPEAAARLAAAQSLPEPVRMSKGDLTRDIPQQGRESSALAGAYGDDASRIFKEHIDGQEADLAGNANSIQRQIGTGDSLTQGQGMQRISQNLVEDMDNAKKSINDAYSEAKKAKAQISTAPINTFKRKVTKDLIEEGFDVNSMPLVQARLGELQKITGNKNIKSVNLRAIQIYRKRLNSNISTAKRSDPSEFAALNKMKHELDNSLENMLDEDLISGSTEALGKWKKAINLRADFGKKYNSNKIIEKLAQKDVTTEEALDFMFGMSKLGTKQSINTTKAVKQLRGTISPDDFSALKEEAFLRLLKDQPAEGFSAQKFITNYDRAMKDAPTLMRELYSKEELTLLSQFRNVSKTTVKDKVAVNASRSGDTLGRMADEMFGAGSRAFKAVFAGRIKAGREGLAYGDAKLATSVKRLEPPKLFGAGTVGAGSGFALGNAANAAAN